MVIVSDDDSGDGSDGWSTVLTKGKVKCGLRSCYIFLFTFFFFFWFCFFVVVVSFF